MPAHGPRQGHRVATRRVATELSFTRMVKFRDRFPLRTGAGRNPASLISRWRCIGIANLLKARSTAKILDRLSRNVPRWNDLDGEESRRFRYGYAAQRV